MIYFIFHHVSAELDRQRGARSQHVDKKRNPEVIWEAVASDYMHRYRQDKTVSDESVNTFYNILRET